MNYHGQALGLLVGSDYFALETALPLIVVTYADIRTPVLTIAEAMANGLSPDQPPVHVIGDVAGRISRAWMLLVSLSSILFFLK